jgi:hypothetical protein
MDVGVRPVAVRNWSYPESDSRRVKRQAQNGRPFAETAILTSA